MKRVVLWTSIVLLLAIGAFCLWGGAKKENVVNVHIIGDSTMADYVENTTRTRGWGEMLQSFYTDDVKVLNYARGGRSSHSFYKEGRWQKVIDQLQSGDYVFIQFAHNDEKEGGKDGADFRGTAPWTTYKHYLETYVDETREHGATPVLITPIIRRYFTKDGSISPKGCHDLSVAPDDSTLNYVRVMKHVARNKQVPLIDMTALTKTYAETLGKDSTTKCIYVPTDGTHTQATGAAEYARLAVKELKRQGILAEYIREDIPLVVNPSALSFNTIFAGEEALVCFDMVGLNLQPQQGTLMIKAPKGMLIADDPHAAPQASLSYDYQDGRLWNKCFYLHYQPTKAGEVKTHVRIDYGSQVHRVPVKASVQEVKERTDIQIALSNPSWRGLTETAEGLTIEGGQWTAEIDEAQKRYYELILKPVEDNLLLRQLSFTLEGEVSYRVACAYGKDFYPRTDLGEAQQGQPGVQQLSFPMNLSLQPGQQLYIRFFPWSTHDSDKLSFRLSDWQLDAVSIK